MKKQVDVSDVFSLAGLVMIGIGIGMISIPGMFIVVGGLLLALGLIGVLRR